MDEARDRLGRGDAIAIVKEASKIHHAKRKEAAKARAPRRRITGKSDPIVNMPLEADYAPVCVKWKYPGEKAPKRNKRAPRHIGDVD